MEKLKQHASDVVKEVTKFLTMFILAGMIGFAFTLGAITAANMAGVQWAVAYGDDGLEVIE